MASPDNMSSRIVALQRNGVLSRCGLSGGIHVVMGTWSLRWIVFYKWGMVSHENGESSRGYGLLK